MKNVVITVLAILVIGLSIIVLYKNSEVKSLKKDLRTEISNAKSRDKEYERSHRYLDSLWKAGVPYDSIGFQGGSESPWPADTTGDPDVHAHS